MGYGYTARLVAVEPARWGEWATQARLRTCRGYRTVPLSACAERQAAGLVGCQVRMRHEDAICVGMSRVDPA